MTESYPYGNPKTTKGARAIIKLIKEKFENKEYREVEFLYKNLVRKTIYHDPLPLKLRNQALDVYFMYFLPAEIANLEDELKDFRDTSGWYAGTISDNKKKMAKFANRHQYPNFYPSE